MLGLEEALKWDLQLFAFYVESHSIFDDHGHGFTLVTLPNEQIFLHARQAFEFLRPKLEKEIGVERTEKLLRDISKEFLNRYPEALHEDEKIEIDILLYKLVQTTIQKRKIVPNHAKTLFRAVDIDNNELISLSEFTTLFRHIESERFIPQVVKKLFLQEADAYSKKTNEHYMSCCKFAEVSIRYDLFSEDQQQDFLKSQGPWNESQNLCQLKENWVIFRNDLNLLLLRRKVDMPFLGNLINWVTKALEKQFNAEPNEEFVIMLSYKLILREAAHILLEGRIQACLLYTSPSPRDRQKSRMPSSA
eukprot:TRINITY_DN11175_c0_g1_i1.p1 TRINITY_DN11175_c0_g1~~TRINITY_DN11175_c0_g1_i1.p1  ORF type:complete len:305 (+),score=60.52 TRINITY_DN11175_c0_g1_i1:205-1119(+)